MGKTVSTAQRLRGIARRGKHFRAVERRSGGRLEFADWPLLDLDCLKGQSIGNPKPNQSMGDPISRWRSTARRGEGTDYQWQPLRESNPHDDYKNGRQVPLSDCVGACGAHQQPDRDLNCRNLTCDSGHEKTGKKVANKLANTI
jgi:hypothetical protein